MSTPSIEAILQEFLHHRLWALDDLPSSDLIDHFLRKGANFPLLEWTQFWIGHPPPCQWGSQKKNQLKRGEDLQSKQMKKDEFDRAMDTDS
jgi:hypothetical protein